MVSWSHRRLTMDVPPEKCIARASYALLIGDQCVWDGHDKMHMSDKCPIVITNPSLYDFEIILTMVDISEMFININPLPQTVYTWKWSFSDRLLSIAPVRMSIRLSVCKLHIPIFFSRTIGPVSTKLGTKHPWPWVKGIQVCSNAGPRSLRMRVNNSH